MLVIGVLTLLPPLTDPDGVDVEVEAPVPPAAFLAAFSARRFCLEAEGAMVVGCQLSIPENFIKFWIW